MGNKIKIQGKRAANMNPMSPLEMHKQFGRLIGKKCTASRYLKALLIIHTYISKALPNTALIFQSEIIQLLCDSRNAA